MGFKSAVLPESFLRCMEKKDRDTFVKGPPAVFGNILDPKPVTERTDRPSISDTSEKELQNQIENYCRLHGWITFRSRMDKKTNRRVGEFDFHCLLPGARVVFVECKSRTGALTEDQTKLFGQMAQLGHRVHVVRALEDFISIISESKSEMSSSNSTLVGCHIQSNA